MSSGRLPAEAAPPNYVLQQTGAINRLVVSQHQVVPGQDHEPIPESPPQLNAGVSRTDSQTRVRMRFLASLLSLTLLACVRPPAGGVDTSGFADDVPDTLAAIAAARGAGNDSAFREVQTRGAAVMGVNQNTSDHVFESLPDGGRVILERPSAADTADIRTIRAHMHEIAAQFRRGDFRAPFLVHAQAVPGTAEMARRAAAITYAPLDRPRGAELRISTQDPAALKAIHEFLAFQRADHRAAGHEGHTGHVTP